MVNGVSTESLRRRSGGINVMCNELEFNKEYEVLKDTFNVSWSNVNPMYLTET